MPGKNNVVSRNTLLLSELLTGKANDLTSKKITAGFDGFVDTIVQVIKTKKPQQPPSFYKTKKEFGEYILQTEGTNCSLELQERSVKLGGNMPIMANALGRLGTPVNCLGAFGYPEAHPVFKALSSNCHLFSFTDPGTATAIEFNDGKIILGRMDKLNMSGWKEIKKIVGLDTITRLYNDSDLLCIVNWAEIDASTDIWEGMLNEVLSTYAAENKKQLAFFDLSDCTKRSDASIKKALGLLQQFAKRTKVIVGLNQNEAKKVFGVFYTTSKGKELKDLGAKIFQKLSIDTLVLHSAREAIVFSNQGTVECRSFFIKEPTISTGAGDNFNAGFCAAQLLDLSPEHSLLFAHAVSASYVKNGISPQLDDVILFLKENNN